MNRLLMIVGALLLGGGALLEYGFKKETPVPDNSKEIEAQKAKEALTLKVNALKLEAQKLSDEAAVAAETKSEDAAVKKTLAETKVKEYQDALSALSGG